MQQQTITRKFEFDAGHRVMNERMKCFSGHGHRYVVELEFAFDSMQEIGYAIDFKEVKRVGCQWIDDMMDHGFLLNPHDKELIETFTKINTKVYLMSLAGKEAYCNPTAENIAKEIFLAMDFLFDSKRAQSTGLRMQRVVLFETPNCWTECLASSVSELEKQYFLEQHQAQLQAFSDKMAVVEYDDRKLGI